MRRLVLIALAALVLGFAPAPFLAPRLGSVEADLKALQGEWTSCDDIVRFQGRRLIEDVVWKVTLDASQTPKVMTLAEESSPPRQILRRNYRLEGDTLTLTWYYKPIRHPVATVIDLPEGERIMVLKRKKP